MAGTTNRIPFEEAADLLARGRACVAFVQDGHPHVEPATVRFDDPVFVVGVAAGSGFGGDVIEASLVIDEGVLFFDLRAISVRGIPSPSTRLGDPELIWFELEPTLVTCWDYGRLRVDDGHD